MKKIIHVLIFVFAFSLCNAQLSSGAITGTYTPAWTNASGTAPSLGNGTLTGSWTINGDVVFFTLYFQAGSTTTFGQAGQPYRFSLPFPMASTNPTFIVNFFNGVTGFYYVGTSVLITTSTIAIYGNASGSGYGPTTPTTWTIPATGQTFMTINGSYKK